MQKIQLITILLVILFIVPTQQYFEIILDRQGDELDIDRTDEIQYNKIQQNNCQYSILMGHNSEYAPQLCYKRDINYNVKVLFGVPFEKSTKNVINMAIDITSPWTWVKAQSCENVSSQFLKSGEVFDREMLHSDQFRGTESCDGDYLQVTNFQKNQYSKQPVIVDNEHLIQGDFVDEQLSFLAYDPEMTQNIIKIMEDEIYPEKRLENHSEIIKIQSYKVVAAEKMVGYKYFSADGAIGLGQLSEMVYGSNNSYEQGTDFLRILKESQDDKIMDKEIFSIFINNKGLNVKEHIITVGGLNPRFAFQGNLDNVHYIPLLRDTAYYWSVNLYSLNINVRQFLFEPFHPDQQTSSIYLENTQAVISLQTSFLSFPLQNIIQIIRILNSFGNTDCVIVDSKEKVVYCKKFSVLHEMSLEFKLNFMANPGEKELGEHGVVLNAQNLIRKCSPDANLAHEVDRYDCILNLQVSNDNKVILGEPFLKQHYTIFDQENKQLGLVPANDDQNWGISGEIINVHFKTMFKVMAYTLMFILASALLLIICMGPIKHGVKNVKGTVLKMKHDNVSFQDAQSLTQSHKEEENPYAEVEAAMREQAMKEIQKMEEQMEEDEKNMTINSMNNNNNDDENYNDNDISTEQFSSNIQDIP